MGEHFGQHMLTKNLSRSSNGNHTLYRIPEMIAEYHSAAFTVNLNIGQHLVNIIMLTKIVAVQNMYWKDKKL